MSCVNFVPDLTVQLNHKTSFFCNFCERNDLIMIIYYRTRLEMINSLYKLYSNICEKYAMDISLLLQHEIINSPVPVSQKNHLFEIENAQNLVFIYFLCYLQIANIYNKLEQKKSPNSNNTNYIDSFRENYKLSSIVIVSIIFLQE